MLKVLAFVPGLLSIGLGGYLAVLENNHFGWFLGVGFIMCLCALGGTMPSKEDDHQMENTQ